jgi:hypothetical protein
MKIESLPFDIRGPGLAKAWLSRLHAPAFSAAARMARDRRSAALRALRRESLRKRSRPSRHARRRQELPPACATPGIFGHCLYCPVHQRALDKDAPDPRQSLSLHHRAPAWSLSHAFWSVMRATHGANDLLARVVSKPKITRCSLGQHCAPGAKGRPLRIEARDASGDHHELGHAQRPLQEPRSQRGLPGPVRADEDDQARSRQSLGSAHTISSRTSIMPITAAEMSVARSSSRRSMASRTLATSAAILVVS